MSRRTKASHPRPAPVQLPLFPEEARLTRVRPERNEWRFYRMEVWPDLFGRALLVRHWGRIGTQGRMRLDPYGDSGAALNALAALLRSKVRRGYSARKALHGRDRAVLLGASCDNLQGVVRERALQDEGFRRRGGHPLLDFVRLR